MSIIIKTVDNYKVVLYLDSKILTIDNFVFHLTNKQFEIVKNELLNNSFDVVTFLNNNFDLYNTEHLE